MAVVMMKQLLESGVHFGHQTRKWSPKMAQYIFGERNGIHIIDLQKTSRKLDEAYNFVKSLVSDGGELMFVGTKKQAQDVVEAEAQRAESCYVNARWLGGMLTNFQTIKTRVDRLKEIETMEEDNSIALRPKKEQILLRKEKDKLTKYLGGIKDMKKVPQALFVVDPKKEEIAIKEAKKLKIKTIGIVDTNCDPDMLDYCIPANDDAIKSIRLLVSKMADAVLEGKEGRSKGANVDIEEMLQGEAEAEETKEPKKEAPKAKKEEVKEEKVEDKKVEDKAKIENVEDAKKKEDKE